MIAAFGGEEKVARFEDIDARTRSHCIEELDLHRVDVLLGEVQRQFVQVAVLALKHEEKRLVVENRARCHEEPASNVVSVSQRDVAQSVLMVGLFVNEEVLADYDDSAWADVPRHLDQHVRRPIHWEDVLTDDMVKTEVHLVECEGLLEVARVLLGLLRGAVFFGQPFLSPVPSYLPQSSSGEF